MPLTLLQETEVVVRVFKRALGNPSYVWSNIYEVSFAAVPGLGYSGYSDLALAFIEAEVPLHHSAVEFVKATVSTWEPNATDQTYHPSESFVVVPAPEATYGTRVMTSNNPLARNVALFVRKTVPFGSSGKLFYRGVLGEVDIETTTALDLRLSVAATADLEEKVNAVQAAINEALVMVGGTLALVRLNTSVTPAVRSIREVTDLVVAGAVANKPNHAYFDRDA